MATAERSQFAGPAIIRFSVPAIPLAQPRPRATIRGAHAAVYEAGSKHPIHAFKATMRQGERRSMKKIAMVLSDRIATGFMQNCDVFEPFKVLVMPTVIAEVSDSFGHEQLLALRANSIGGPYELVACVTPEMCFVDPLVKVVSNGNNWCLLTDFVGSIRL